MSDQFLRIVEGRGHAGIAAAMCAEHVFPPIPSEIIMPLIGFGVASG